MISKLEKKIHNLKHGDKVILNGNKGTVGTVAGYAVQYNEDPIEAIKRNASFGHSPHPWINKEAACICSYKGYYEKQDEIWKDAILVNTGDLVWIEGKMFYIHYNGNYSNMADLRPLVMEN